ncbi:MAG: hypothetical protein Q7S81_00255 [bacterium]|nr:hypothetical protein [bacterium]
MIFTIKNLMTSLKPQSNNYGRQGQPASNGVKLKYFKKISAVLLIGFIFTINTIPVSFSQTATDCSKIKPNLGAGSGQECGSNCQISSDSTSCIQKGSVSDNATNPPIISGDTTVKSTDIEQCLTVGYSIKKDGSCDGIKVECKGDQNGWRCINKILTTTDLNSALKSPFKDMKYIPKIVIPCSTNIAGGTCPKGDDPAGYIARLYQFGLMIAGLIALGVILYGAVEYTLSAGGVASKEEAKDRMLQAIYGILLLLSAYLILYTINPKLVSLTNPEFQAVDLSTLVAPEIFVSDNAGNNTIAESSGTGGITGCALANSSWGQGLLEVKMNTGETLGTGSGKVNCLRCMEGNVGPDKDGNCTCSEGLVRQPTGACIVASVVPCKIGTGGPQCSECISGYSKVNNECKITCVGGREVNNQCICNAGYSGVSCNVCTSGYLKFGSKCVACSIKIPTPSCSVTGGFSCDGTPSTCIPK